MRIGILTHVKHPVRQPFAGGMKEIAFIKDPDGYWVEVIQFTPLS